MPDQTSSRLSWQQYQDEDYQEVIDFLSLLYRMDITKPYWLPGRWEYATYLCSPLFRERGYPDWKRFIRLVREEGRIVGIVNSENPDDDVFIHTHPDYKHLEGDLLGWAENNFETEAITVWSLAADNYRNELLIDRGYKKQELNDYLNWCKLDEYEPTVRLPEGYVIASYKDGFDLSSRIRCSARAFDSREFSIDVYRFMQSAPDYDPALDLVVKYGGNVVSLCTFWVDPANNLAYVEPVATAPEHQRKGLGRALLNEGLKRLKSSNIGTAYVGSTGDWRRSFYRSVGFTESVLCKPWTKREIDSE